MYYLSLSYLPFPARTVMRMYAMLDTHPECARRSAIPTDWNKANKLSNGNRRI
jgi:hypothetical protein